MRCKNCGREIPNESNWCLYCGKPAPANVNRENIQTKPSETADLNKENIQVKPSQADTCAKHAGLSVVAVILSSIAFLAGFVMGGLCYEHFTLLFIFDSITILPALAGMSIGAYVLAAGRNGLTNGAKASAVISVVFSALVLLFLFLTTCLIATGAV